MKRYEGLNLRMKVHGVDGSVTPSEILLSGVSFTSSRGHLNL